MFQNLKNHQIKYHNNQLILKDVLMSNNLPIQQILHLVCYSIQRKVSHLFQNFQIIDIDKVNNIYNIFIIKILQNGFIIVSHNQLITRSAFLSS